ncbi:unnamed protein product [Colias eurytheme]|nr:unnamed protein product [Colias eurytheme]
MMWKYSVFGVIALLVNINCQNSDLADAIFSESSLENRTVDQAQCNTIVGVTQGCWECYLCTHHSVRYHKAKEHYINNLTLYKDDCTSTEVCCVNQQDLNDYRSNDKCGVDNPEGRPRRVRPSVHSILQGQYPWRAWVYIDDMFLCAATYINEAARALVTLASCVNGYPVKDLVVTFDKDGDEQTSVQEVIIHPEYNKTKPLNDIAIIILDPSDSLPRSATEACVPQSPVKFGKSCISASEDNLEVNSRIPLQSRCNSTLLHPSLMCTVSHKDAFRPELGGGLFCLEEVITTALYKTEST